MPETTPRREATRTRLIHAAIAEFGERGIDATSVEHLCVRAGFTRGAFYSNFSSKDDVCIAILELYGEQAMAGLQAIAVPDEGAGPDWAFREALPSFFRALGPTANFRRTMLEVRVRAQRSPELADRLARLEAETRPAIDAALDDVSARTGIRFRLPTHTVVELCHAVFFHPSEAQDVDEALLTSLLIALSDV